MISILFTVVIWVQTKFMMEQTSTISLPIRYKNQNEQTSPSHFPSKASFKVNGRGLDIVRLKLFHVYAQYISPINNNEDNIVIDNFELSLPYNVSIIAIEPANNDAVTLSEPMINYNVNVVLDFADSKTRNAFNKMSYKLSNDKVEILLPQKLVDRINSLKTQPITTDMLKSDKIKLKLVYPYKNIELKSDSVYLLKVDKEIITKVISNIPIHSDKKIDFFPKDVSVRIRGNIDQIKLIKIDSIVASLFLEEEDDKQIPILISVPKEIEIVDYSPQKVTKLN